MKTKSINQDNGLLRIVQKTTTIPNPEEQELSECFITPIMLE